MGNPSIGDFPTTTLPTRMFPSSSRDILGRIARPTNTPITNDVGLTFCCGVGAAANISSSNNPMVDPFPVRADGTRFDIPYGNSFGLVAFARRGLTFIPAGFQPARQQRWRVGVQRQFGNNILLDVSYNGSYARIPVSQPVSFLPQQYWATGNVRTRRSMMT